MQHWVRLPERGLYHVRFMSKVAVGRGGFVPQGNWAVFTIMRHDQTGATIGTKASARNKGRKTDTIPAFP